MLSPNNFKGNPVRKDSVDYILHLGDYIYEYPNGAYGWGQSIGSSSSHIDDQGLTIVPYRPNSVTRSAHLHAL